MQTVERLAQIAAESLADTCNAIGHTLDAAEIERLTRCAIGWVRECRDWNDKRDRPVFIAAFRKALGV